MTSCKWEEDTTSLARATRITENEFVIANKEASVVLINCEDNEKLEYHRLKKGNNILKANSNCLVKEEGINPSFSFWTQANQKNISFELQNINATYIDPLTQDLDQDIDNEMNLIKRFNKLQNILYASKENNKTTEVAYDLAKAMKQLNTSHNHNIRANTKLQQDLHHQSF